MRKLILAALLLVPAAALAASPFDGTWKTRMDSMKVTGKPDVIAIADGMYDCSTCVPAINVKADGTDQKVTGHPYYDTIAIAVVSPTSIEVTTKNAGKTVGVVAYSVSADGKTLTGKFQDYSGAKEATGSFTQTRGGPAPAGAHATSGTWQADTMTGGNDALTTVALQMTDQDFSSRWNGQSYNAKFDGKQVPVKGDPGHTMVSLKRIDANTVVETDSRAGKVTDEIHMAAAADGKTIAVTDKDLLHDQVTTYTLDKQQ